MTTRPAKEEYRPLCLALQADAKSFGIAKIARQWGVNPETLANQLNPSDRASLPSSGKLFEIINLVQAERTVFEICQLVGKVPVDIEVEERAPEDAIKILLEMISQLGDFIKKGGEAAADLRLDAQERKELDDCSRQIIQIALGLRASINSLRG